MAREFQITEKDLVATSINVAGLLTASRQRFSERTQNDQIEFNKFLAGDISFDDLQEHFAKRLATPKGSAERAAIEATQLDAKEQNQFNLDVAAVNNFKNGLWGYDQFINYFEGRQGEEAVDSDDFISIDNILTQVRNNQNRFEIDNRFFSGVTNTQEYFDEFRTLQDVYRPGSQIWNKTQADIVTAAQNAFDDFGHDIDRSVQEMLDRAQFARDESLAKYQANQTPLNLQSLESNIELYDNLRLNSQSFEFPEFNLENFLNQDQFQSNALSSVAGLVPFGTPFKSPDSPDVFIQTAQGIQRIQNEQEFFRQFPSFDVVQEIPSNVVNAISGITDQPIGATPGLFRVEGAPAIYQTSGGIASAFANEDAFFKRGFNFGQETVISQSEFDEQFTTGDLIF